MENNVNKRNSNETGKKHKSRDEESKIGWALRLRYKELQALLNPTEFSYLILVD